ncbi:hypothetical protein MIND_00608000 [Mycena indigotica]|uniref:Uncharacterized protein n=1 Tax=Mycena indigotica TaxID=2126181 RepID=A0A8H6SQX7_9AGAR|nr:uncharacterized protein MIND_00608000 [Mycena indigotica]KAF7303784.1 hypothetical protein MIND_00608000 [Mycena indigotica]
MSTTHPPFVAHDPKHIDPEKPRRATLATVPDMFRFEFSYLRSIQPFVQLVPWKGKGKAGEQATTELAIQWLQVGWVTARDQVFSPFAQGALWAIAGYLFTPLAQSFIPHRPEGGFSTWLRASAQRLRLTTPSRL